MLKLLSTVLLLILGSTMQSDEPLSTDSINALNVRCYDARADVWDRMPFADFLPKQILLKHHLQAGMNALDIGSGTGMLAEWLAKQGFAVQCIDPSDEMVRRCRAKGLNTFQTTLQNFHPKEKFGLITAVLSFIHLPKREMAQELQRIAGWLNPEGTFVLAMIQGTGEGIGEKHSSHPRYFSYYTKEEILALTAPHFGCVFYTETHGPVSYLVFIFDKLS
jgi:2-polyprenyl-3-methyl-5-hydroxy-6-metoxy-1,4-benzoquinol methylase